MTNDVVVCPGPERTTPPLSPTRIPPAGQERLDQAGQQGTHQTVQVSWYHFCNTEIQNFPLLGTQKVRHFVFRKYTYIG